MRLYFRKYGDGPPLIILHGLFGSSDNWHTLARRLGSFFTVYALDQRNHGSSPHESPMNYHILAQDLAQFMDQHQIKTAGLIGHSMGGKTALLFASLFPEHVTGLAVLDIGIDAVTEQHKCIKKALKQINPEAFSERSEILNELTLFIDSLPVRQFLLKNVMRCVDGSFTWKFNRDALLEHYDDLAAALVLRNNYEGPVIFLRGGLSPYLEETLNSDILHYFPRAQLTTIEQAGHWLHAEQPQRVFKCLVNFFEKHLL